MQDSQEYYFGLVCGFLMGKDAPADIQHAARRLSEKSDPRKTTIPSPAAIKAALDQFDTETKKLPSDELIDREVDRVENLRTTGIKKPRKPFSADELDRRRKQLAIARERRKGKSETTLRDANTKDMFSEKN